MQLTKCCWLYVVGFVQLALVPLTPSGRINTGFRTHVDTETDTDTDTHTDIDTDTHTHTDTDANHQNATQIGALNLVGPQTKGFTHTHTHTNNHTHIDADADADTQVLTIENATKIGALDLIGPQEDGFPMPLEGLPHFTQHPNVFTWRSLREKGIHW